MAPLQADDMRGKVYCVDVSRIQIYSLVVVAAMFLRHWATGNSGLASIICTTRS